MRKDVLNCQESLSKQPLTVRDDPEKYLLLAYESFTLGWGSDERGDYVAILISHAGGPAAIKNIERLKVSIYSGPWNSLISDLEIRSDDRLVIGKLWGDKIVSLLPIYGEALEGMCPLAHE